MSAIGWSRPRDAWTSVAPTDSWRSRIPVSVHGTSALDQSGLPRLSVSSQDDFCHPADAIMSTTTERGSGRPGERPLSALKHGRITLGHSAITVLKRQYRYSKPSSKAVTKH